MGKPRRQNLRPPVVAPSAAEVLTDAPAPSASSPTATLPRREFLAKGSATIAFLAAFQLGTRRAEASTSRSHSYFTYGVASGDPLPDRMIIWTRVNPSADATPGSGLGKPTKGKWEVARDRSFKRRVASGSFETSADSDHTVKIDVGGLQPYNRYYYRFTVRDSHSPLGTFITAPAPSATPSSVRFGMVSCSNFEAGYFSAYRHLADRKDIDFVLHLGDYIYEYAQGQYGPEGFAGVARAHDPATEITTLADYRRRHACYKADHDLRRLHSRHCMIATWDDHETANNAWRDGAENHTPGTEGLWAQRKSDAIKAYYEWMPVRQPAATGAIGEAKPIYRKFSFGTLVDLLMLDLRSYRDEQPASPGDFAAINNPARSILGPLQTSWLQSNLVASPARWKLLGNSVQIAPIVVIPALLPPATAALLQAVFGVPATSTVPTPINVDSWDGYASSRLQILGLIGGAAGSPVPNCVFLTGDIHSSYACDIPANPAGYNPASSPSLGTEFVVTSVTSDNVNEIVGTPERVPDGTGGYIRFPGIPAGTPGFPNGAPSIADFENLIRAFNAWVRDVNFDSHGFSIVDVNAERSQIDNWILSSDASPAFAADPRVDRDAQIVFRNAFETLHLSQKASPAAGPLGPRS